MISSCSSPNKECKTITESFSFPEDLIELEEKNYICNNHTDISQVYHDGVRFLFADKNYEIVRFGSVTRLLIDKRNNMNFVFKTIEPEDFTVNRINKEENQEYGIYEIYLVNSDFEPIYSINKDMVALQSLIKYEDVRKNSFSYSKIELIASKMPIINTMSYEDLIYFFKNLSSSDYLVKEKRTTSLDSGKPIWDEY